MPTTRQPVINGIMSRSEILRLSAETGVSIPTVKKWLADQSDVQTAIAYALRAGCRVLKLDPPQEPNTCPAVAS